MASNDIPRLTYGPHFGFLEGFEALGTTIGGTDRQMVADDLRSQSVDAGMTISRVLIDWSTLETAKGVYDRDAINEALEYAERQGVSPFVTLSTLDSEELTLPTYLDGKALNSDDVSLAWVDLLQWLVPILKQRGVWSLSMGNEIGILIGDGEVGEKEALDFYKLGARTIKALDPDMATTITFSTSVDSLIPDLLPKLVRQLDIVSYNYAGLDAGLKTLTKKQWAADTARFKALAGDKDIIIQELGAPAGYGDAGKDAPPQPDGLINSSPDYQARFLKYMMKQVAFDDQLRAAVVFQLYDWSPELAGASAQPLRDDGFDKLADKFEEWLTSTGMVRWADATPREVYGKWLEGLNLAQAVRLDDYDNDPDGRVPLDFRASGEIGYRGDTDLIGFMAGSTGRYVFELEPENTALGALKSPDLKVYSTDGTLLKSGRDNGADGQKVVLGLERAEQVTFAASGIKPGDLGGWTLSAYQLLPGGAGNDDLGGTELADYIRGFAGRDTLNGGGGADKIFGDAGHDRIIGGTGRDLLYGGTGGDDISGRLGADVLLGGPGRDTLVGGRGADILVGGRGLDVMTGGKGADFFVFTEGLIDGSSTNGSSESITDFNSAVDLLIFTDVDADIGQSGNQSFTYIATNGFTGRAGELRFDGQLLSGDVDGDGNADFTLLLIGINELTASSLLV